MTNEESIQSHQPRSMFSTWIGVVLLFAIFGLLALVIVRASPRGDTYEAKRVKVRAEKLEAAQKENKSALTTYGWVDKTKGVARIPIEHAMQLTMAELAQKKPAAANPIAAAEASPAAQAASPAAPATSPGGSATPMPSPSPSPAASVGTTPKPTSVSGAHSESHNQPAAAANPPAAPPNSQPGPSATPGGSPSSAAAKAPVSPTPPPTPAAPGTPLPVRGKTP